MRLYVSPDGRPPRRLPIALCLIGLLWSGPGRAQSPCLSDEPLDEAVVVLTFGQPALQLSLAEATTRALQSMLLEGLLLCPADSPAAAMVSASVWITEVPQPLARDFGLAVPTSPELGLFPPENPPGPPPDAGTSAPASAVGDPQDAGVPPQVQVPPPGVPPTESLTPAPPPPPMAPLPLAGQLRIAISDHITAKMVVRDLQLNDFPQDTWPLAIAIACDELLRASWLELAITPQRGRDGEEKRAVPSAVRARVQQDLDQAKSETSYPAALFVRGALNWYSGGATLFGADVGVRKRLHEHLGIALGLGGRRGPWHQDALGRVRLSTVHFEGDVEYTVADDHDTQILLRAGPSCLIAYAGGDKPSTMTAVRNRVGIGVGTHVGVAGTVSLFPPVGLLWAMDVGYSIRALSVEDSRRRVLTSTKGLEIQVSVGLEFGR